MKIAVLSREANTYSTKRLLEAIAAKGHEALLLNHSKCYCVTEKGSPKIFNGENEIKDVSAIIPRIGASVSFYGGCIVRQFETQGVFTTVGSIALSRSRDKLRSLQVLAEKEIDIPKTAFARHPNDVDNLIKAVGGPPLIIKILEGTQGKGVVLAETKSAAKSVIQGFQELEANIIVQEFIKESKGEDIRAFVINGSVVAAMMRTAQNGEFRSNLHRGGKSLAIKLTKEEEITAIKASAALGLKVCGVDIIRSNSGPKVIEVNSSPGLEGVEKATKIDIAGMIVQYIESSCSKKKKRDAIGV